MRRSSILTPFALLVPVALGASSCREHRVDPLEAQARDLFAKSSAMIRAYTDSMAAAKDSTTWARLDNAFDKEMARLNFDFPADTDLRLTEGENDTLSLLTDAYVQARQASLDRILHPTPLPADTVPGD